MERMDMTASTAAAAPRVWPGKRLGGGNQGDIFPEDPFNGDAFCQIIIISSGTMSIDIINCSRL